MTTEQLFDMLDEHEKKCEEVRLRKSGRTGNLYLEMEALVNEAAMHKQIIRNKLVALCAKYEKANVEWMYKIVMEDKKYGVSTVS